MKTEVMSRPLSKKRKIATSSSSPTRNGKSTTDRRLRRQNLNVSRGGKIYERASSRRSRHRLVLQDYSKDAVPLKRESAVTTYPTAKKVKTVFQDDREEQDKQLDWRAFKLASILREGVPRLAPVKRQREVSAVQVVQPKPTPDRTRKSQLLEKQHAIRETLSRKLEKQMKEETKKLDSVTAKRVDLLIQAAREKVSSPQNRKTICRMEPSNAMPYIPNASQQQGVPKPQLDSAAPRLPRIAMRRKPVPFRVRV
mmetsp:Transcript_135664/g.201762  ORF Transcript_135664/g.201762 Transcript_135664/m.201762 type:complete len:254 (-) Transcript_135664:260-1021(-)|eukprot:CAMPEP_0117027788 /NCGR_PEP_ID=MMETSP0472-20121206/20273_1 /TAXON_ID=693140 ORGANISM="Tiarina fusus, Strain LIS" /NCGR_SAMPLE_ID=MMETSP0472 /ASSEMBLY_ACC=CAM_ASM_000603 /LENGTH=253 /DNA_ID=CAMNT_0004735117 /DNA_START=241 /DNA_END=1002 /DNA_ORIENTATION=+